MDEFELTPERRQLFVLADQILKRHKPNLESPEHVTGKGKSPATLGLQPKELDLLEKLGYNASATRCEPDRFRVYFVRKSGATEYIESRETTKEDIEQYLGNK